MVLTNKRFIVNKPKLLGSVNFEDHIWRDLSDITLREGMINATLSMKAAKGRLLLVDNLPKAQARKLYSFAQDMEEQVREERRIREMEERRAAAGGVTIHGSLPTTNMAAPVQDDPVQKLKQLKAMLDAELITQEEYDAKKTDLLSRM